MAFPTENPVCVLDRNLMNADTIKDMDNIGLSIFAPLCGRNRGAFILDPPDGKTYGCISFPERFAQLVGVDPDSVTDSNSIPNGYADGTLTGAEAVDLVDLYLQSVYASSADVDSDPYACDCAGLAMLECSDKGKSLLEGPVRAATLAGVFVPAPWATGGKTLSLEEAKGFYTSDDFVDMVALGLNTVQIPVPVGVFAANGNGLIKSALSNLLELVKASGLNTILVADDEEKQDDHQAAAAAAAFAEENKVLALTLPSSTSTIVSAARSAAPTLPLLVPTGIGDLKNLAVLDDNMFAAVPMGHSSTVADVASSSSVEDRMKMFYHEATACISRSPIEYATCYKGVPVFVSEGFDLSIDDCIHKSDEDFKDFGQCGRLEETANSRWWKRHRQSLAKRQLYAFERGVGWSFSAWKLYGNDESSGVIDIPAKLMSLKDVAAAGLMPSFEDASTNLACLNGPVADFAMGDKTYAPTPSPPPDCGNGWWNFETLRCDYWIPPEDRVPPEEGLAMLGMPNPNSTSSSPYHAGIFAAAGAIVALVLNALFSKFRRNTDRRGYANLP